MTNVIRLFAEGGGPSLNQENIRTLNASVKQQIGHDDVFRNYHLVGAVWAEANSLIPPGTINPPDSTSLPAVNRQVGSIALSNTTMETFFQTVATTTTPAHNCLTCHNTTTFPTAAPAKNMNLSHIMMQLLEPPATANTAALETETAPRSQR